MLFLHDLKETLLEFLIPKFEHDSLSHLGEMVPIPATPRLSSGVKYTEISDFIGNHVTFLREEMKFY